MTRGALRDTGAEPLRYRGELEGFSEILGLNMSGIGDYWTDSQGVRD